ncbi:MAG: hypothetical protein AAGA48_36680 [Myxococcota bacterium]
MSLAWTLFAIACMGTSDSEEPMGGETGTPSTGEDTGNAGPTGMTATDTGTPTPGGDNGTATYTITATNELNGTPVTQMKQIALDGAAVGVTYEEGDTDAIVQLTLGQVDGSTTDAETVAIVAQLDFAGTDRDVPTAGGTTSLQPVLISSRASADFVGLMNSMPVTVLQIDGIQVTDAAVTFSNYDGTTMPYQASCFSDAAQLCETWAGQIDLEASVSASDGSGNVVELELSGRSVLGWQRAL